MAAALIHAGVEASPPLTNGRQVLERFSAGEIAELGALWQDWDSGTLEVGAAGEDGQ